MQSPLEVRFHPVNLRDHGTTPGGLSLYRVVWSDSRVGKMLFRGRMHTYPLYDTELAAGKWILEKWLDAEHYLGMSRKAYEDLMRSLGDVPTEAYPEEGDYQMVRIFPGHVDEVSLHELVSMIEWRLKNVTLEHRKQEVIEHEKQKQVVAEQQKHALFDEIAGRDAPKAEVKRTYVH